MPFPHMPHLDLETTTKVAGRIGSSVALVKAAIPCLNDKSLDRQLAKTIDEIDATTKRLYELQECKQTLSGVDIDQVEAQIRTDLETKLEHLTRFRETKLRRLQTSVIVSEFH